MRAVLMSWVIAGNNPAHVYAERHVSIAAERFKLLGKQLERDERDVRVVHGLEGLTSQLDVARVASILTMPSSVQSRLPSVTSSLIAACQSWPLPL